MCRHVIGLNHVSIGIEFVEERSANRILNRPRQVAAGHALVGWLQSRFGIATNDVIGHGTANRSRFFRDDRGWKNDHTDWQAAQLRRFRAGL
jgi:N-acetyl-anhydromuramyl-L-alanine amidase AmpD